jgi:dipeptidyl aminopeptidase/acylaminoacyl peptidase
VKFKTIKCAIAIFAFTICQLTLAAGCEAEELYQSPPKAIADLVEKPPTPAALLSFDHKHMLLCDLPTLPSIADISQPELRLAGQRLNPKTNGESKPSYYTGISYLDMTKPGSQPQRITGIPEKSKIKFVNWSPDCKTVSFVIFEESAIRLWKIDIATRQASKLIDAPLNAFRGNPVDWCSDGSLLVRLIPENRGAPPEKNAVPRGPLVQENDGKKRPARTEPDVLKNPNDEALLDYYLRSQIARVQLDGRTEPIGKPDNYYAINPSPDAKHIVVVTIHRPYSYKVLLERFPHRVEIWSPAGSIEKLLVDNPLMEEVPIDFAAVPSCPRAFDWRSDSDATVTWVEARDGGDPKVKADIRDEVMALAAPFTDKPTAIAHTALRYGDVTWGTGEIALLSEWWWADRRSKTSIFAPDTPGKNVRVLWDRSFEDRYSDPGRPDTKVTNRRVSILHITARGELLLSGQGASPEGDRPFLDILDLKTLATKRLWRSEAPYYEHVSSIFDDDGKVFLSRRESVSEQPQYFLRDLKKKSMTQLTHFPNPNPDINGKIEKKLVRYKRADGVDLSGFLYTPPGFEAGKSKPLPMLMWVYPSEFKTRSAASQVQDSPYRFVRLSHHGPAFALLMGFSVLDDPTMPIVGEGKSEPNDTYVQQLVSDAQAAVDEMVKLGVADRSRIAIAGHSYGAFTAANLLAHSNLFRAGIARSGAFNRTLTPFGFQSEERTFWQAKDTYVNMSPFTHADKIDEPLLLIHGENDDNQGTYPVQSERLFEAMKGLGGRVRWVVLPNETHGYRAKESVLHALKEMSDWLGKYVETPLPAVSTEATGK